MPVSVQMPQLGESVSEGTVTRWLKKEGDHVETDEPLLEVSTEKVDTEIPSPASGTLQSISASEDETVEVGTEIGTIAEGEGAEQPPSGGGEPSGGESSQQAAPAQPEPAAQQAPPQPAAPAQQPQPEEQPQPAARQAAPQQAPPQPAAQQAPPQPAAQQPAAQQPAAQQPQPEQQPAETGGAATPYVTPLVRKLAAEHSVDLSTVTGTGVGGRIRKQDVQETARQQQARQPQAHAAAAPPQAPAAQQRQAPPAPAPEEAQLRGRTEKMSRTRAVIARRMVESLQTSAQLTTVVEVDVTRIARLRERAKADFQAREGVKLSFLPFFAQATVEALKAHPKVNASIDTEQGEITYHDAEHLAMAVDTDRGLIVPVIRDAGDLNLGGLARKIADLAERTRTANISPDELSGGTFTLTNVGSVGAITDTPIINQPQVGILGAGKVVKRAVVMEDPDLGEVFAARSIAQFPLTYDHRLVDGADAARFLQTVKTRLEEGNFEAELGLD